MQYPNEVFREYDVRGIAAGPAPQITPSFAFRLGQAYSVMLKATFSTKTNLRVSVGRDCRLSGEVLAQELMRGIRSQGIHVVDLNICPTPLTYFSVFHYCLDGGIMITGSHNPPEYNGFKICIGTNTLHGEGIQKLKNEMIAFADNSSFSPGNLSQKEIIPDYLKTIYEPIKLKCKRKLKVVLDAGNGTAATVAPHLFELLGAEVVPLFCTLDGTFPNHHPDPTVPKNLKDLIQTVKREKADFGVGFDGDADRIGVVDEAGKIIYGDELMIIFSRAVLKQIPGATIISEVKSSSRLYDDIKKHGGRGIMWKTGHSLIKSKMIAEKAALAGEMSGHIFFADRYFGYDDAIYAAARLYEIVSASDKKLSAFTADLDPVFNTPEIRIDCEEAKKFSLIEELKNILSNEFEKINPIDGIRVDSVDGWALARASNTQPVIVLRFESSTHAGLQRLANKFQSGLNTATARLGHPTVHFDF